MDSVCRKWLRAHAEAEESGIPRTLAHLACRLLDQFARRLEGFLRQA